MAFINCPRCGMSIDANNTFCGNCGYSLQASGSAASYPPQGQPGQRGPAYPSSYATEPPVQQMPFSNESTSSSAPTYRSGGTLPPFSNDNTPSSAPTYRSGGTPPPPPFGNVPSSASYPQDGSYFTQPAYPNNAPYMPQQPIQPLQPIQPIQPIHPPQPPQKPRRSNKGVIAISIVVLLVILAGTAFAGFYFYTSHNSSTAKNNTSTTPTTAATSAITPTDTTTTQAGASITPTDTTTSQTGVLTTPTVTSATPTVTTTTTGDYTAIHPGPGCDTSGGTWTPQDINGISCGTQLTVNGSTRGYLYLQLPNNKAFSASNIIGVSGDLGNGSAGYCVGLAEQGTTTGYLAEYCADGSWFVYSISSGGAVVQTRAKSLTSTRSSEQLSLTIKGSTLSFSIDTEVHNISITPIQPTRVAITFATAYYSSNITVTNFSYTALS